MKNKYTITGDIVHIHMANDLTALVDLNQFDKVNEFPNTWYAKYDNHIKGYYVWGNSSYINGKRKTIQLHRFLMDEPNVLVDHINGNGLDNRIKNLRLATYSENRQNRHRLDTHNTSGVRGVSWNKRQQKWIARIGLNGVRHFIGYFSTLEEAKQAVIKFRKENCTHDGVF